MIRPDTVLVNRKRILQLNGRKLLQGPVIYWMSRDQRVRDNWALLYAFEIAAELNTYVLVAFALTGSFPGANLRHYGFMLRGLAEIERMLAAKNIPFRLVTGNPPESIGMLAKDVKAGAIVTDFDPLRIKKEWKNELVKIIDVPLFEVDAHNVVPCHIASDKQEFGAYTIRPKIKRLLNEYIEEFPEIPASVNIGNREGVKGTNGRVLTTPTDWDAVKKILFASINTEIREVTWLVPGEDAARTVLDNFIRNRLPVYNERRNDPNAGAVSDLSPFLHFGQISAQRIALELIKTSPGDQNSEAFLEELIVRRELSDNFCHYNPFYDSFEGFPSWAKSTLHSHRNDEREYIYSKDQFETGSTHDRLWNAAQGEMVTKGKMHGYMRMYWAKKILEWTSSPEEALAIAISLNDKYELDGRDPNGYTGCAWSVGGVHDRAWGERPVFGKVRYMNDKGCKRKFNTAEYIKTHLNQRS